MAFRFQGSVTRIEPDSDGLPGVSRALWAMRAGSRSVRAGMLAIVPRGDQEAPWRVTGEDGLCFRLAMLRAAWRG